MNSRSMRLGTLAVVMMAGAWTRRAEGALTVGDPLVVPVATSSEADTTPALVSPSDGTVMYLAWLRGSTSGRSDAPSEVVLARVGPPLTTPTAYSPTPATGGDTVVINAMTLTLADTTPLMLVAYTSQSTMHGTAPAYLFQLWAPTPTTAYVGAPVPAQYGAITEMQAADRLVGTTYAIGGVVQSDPANGGSPYAFGVHTDSSTTVVDRTYEAFGPGDVTHARVAMDPADPHLAVYAILDPQARTLIAGHPGPGTVPASPSTAPFSTVTGLQSGPGLAHTRDHGFVLVYPPSGDPRHVQYARTVDGLSFTRDPLPDPILGALTGDVSEVTATTDVGRDAAVWVAAAVLGGAAIDVWSSAMGAARVTLIPPPGFAACDHLVASALDVDAVYVAAHCVDRMSDSRIVYWSVTRTTDPTADAGVDDGAIVTDATTPDEGVAVDVLPGSDAQSVDAKGPSFRGGACNCDVPGRLSHGGAFALVGAFGALVVSRRRRRVVR